MRYAPGKYLDGDRPPMSIERANELQEQAWALQAEGRLDEAFADCVEALHLVEAAEGPNSPDAANLLNDLAEIERDRQNYAAALILAQRARSIEIGLGEQFTGETAARIGARTCSLLGELQRMQGEYGLAEDALVKALDILTGEFGEASEMAAEGRNDLAVLYKYCGRFDEALRLYEQAYATLTTIQGERSLAVSRVLHNIGGVYHSQCRFMDAEEPGRKAWEISRELLGDDDPVALLDAAAYAAILDGLECYDESVAIYRRVIAAFTRSHGAEHYEVAANLHNLAAAVESLGQFEEAEQHYRRSLAIKEKLLGIDNPDVALTGNNLGRLLVTLGRADEAVALLKRAVATLEKQLKSDHPHLAAARRNLRAATAAFVSKGC
jgi:tetratricopeptide (TPR) repeat protein